MAGNFKTKLVKRLCVWMFEVCFQPELFLNKKNIQDYLFETIQDYLFETVLQWNNNQGISEV